MINIEKHTVFERGLTITEPDFPVPVEGFRLSMTVDGVETAIRPGRYDGRVILEPTEAYHKIGSFSMAGDDDFEYRAALYIDESGINESRSVLSAIRGGSYDSQQAREISIEAHSDDFNGIIVSGDVRYHISDASFFFPSANDGQQGCDFTGYGAVIFALNGAEVILENCEFYTEGVVRPCVYVDEHANVIMKNCRYQVMGGTLFQEYQYNAETDKMVAAPWVLGLKGNCRGTNVMGFNSSLTIVDSVCTANGWGVISTDIGSNQKVTVVDSLISLPLEANAQGNPYLKRFGSGYGSYSTGDYANCRQYFYGVQFQVGTYATIFNCGDAVYASSKGDIVVECPDEYPGRELCRVTGKGRPTVIDSDGFGFMTHNLLNTNHITVTDGTVVNSAAATFLLRGNNTSIRVEDGAELNPADGILLQMMDNDDCLVGTVASDDPLSCVFNTIYQEPLGWPSENGSVTAEKNSGDQVDFYAANVDLHGNFYNGTGYYGLAAHKLRICLDQGAYLRGGISATETRHVDETGKQKASFTSDQYYYIGRVENRPFFNGNNIIDVLLKGDAMWTVTQRSTIRSLLVTDCACIQAPEGKTLSIFVDGVPVQLERNRLYRGSIELDAN